MSTGNKKQIHPHYHITSTLTSKEIKARIERAKIEDVKIRPLMDKVKNLLLKLN